MKHRLEQTRPLSCPQRAEPLFGSRFSVASRFLPVPCIPAACRWPCGEDSSGAACPGVLPSCAELPVPPGQAYFSKVRRHIFTHKIEINLHLLCGVLTAFVLSLVDKDFLHKFIEHSGGQGIEIFVFVKQGDKLFCRQSNACATVWASRSESLFGTKKFDRLEQEIK